MHAALALQTVAVVGGQPDNITADARGDLMQGHGRCRPNDR
jgi:hypothetical protein